MVGLTNNTDRVNPAMYEGDSQTSETDKAPSIAAEISHSTAQPVSICATEKPSLQEPSTKARVNSSEQNEETPGPKLINKPAPLMKDARRTVRFEPPHSNALFQSEEAYIESTYGQLIATKPTEQAESGSFKTRARRRGSVISLKNNAFKDSYRDELQGSQHSSISGSKRALPDDFDANLQSQPPAKKN